MADWFEKVFGFKEKTGSEYRKTHAMFDLKLEGKKSKLTVKGKDGKDGRAFQVGGFKIPNLYELRHFYDKDEKLIMQHLKTGPLKVREIVSDVAELHTNPDNIHAVFQVASQFNCLEFPDPSQKPEDGITVYEYDRTQGPACAIACAPGTVYRNYFAMKDNMPQTKDGQVNNLFDVIKWIENDKHKYFTCSAGYTDASNDSLEKFNQMYFDTTFTEKKIEDNKDEIRTRLKIGQHIDTQVTGSGFGRNVLPREASDKQIVTQVYCSACSVSYSGASEEKWANFAQIVLEAAYEGVMYTAIKNALMHNCQQGSKKVFLTALGGGVFGNRNEWITKAMERAFNKFKGINLEVYIVSYGDSWSACQYLLKDYN